jgi:hypothetical protein
VSEAVDNRRRNRRLPRALERRTKARRHKGRGGGQVRHRGVGVASKRTRPAAPPRQRFSSDLGREQ